MVSLSFFFLFFMMFLESHIGKCFSHRQIDGDLGRVLLMDLSCLSVVVVLFLFLFFDFVLNVAGLDKLERKRIGLRHPSNSSADHKTNERIVSLEKCFVFSCFIFKLGMERES